jgi:anti-anti-sigma regulatory factor
LTVTLDDLAGLDELSIARLREQLLQMLAGNASSSILCFDVTNLKLLPSVMLGLLASLKRQVGTVEILNPSKDAQEVIKLMGFDKLFKIRIVPK